MNENVIITEEYRQVIAKCKNLIEVSSKIQLMDLCTHIISTVTTHNVRTQTPCTSQQIIDYGMLKGLPFEAELNAEILDYFIAFTALSGLLKRKYVNIYDENNQIIGNQINYRLNIFKF